MKTPTTMQTVEPGIYRRRDPRSGKLLKGLWIHYPGPDGATLREPVGSPSAVKARKLRAKRIEEAGRGEPGRAAEKVRVSELLDMLATDYKANGRRSLRTLTSHLKTLRPAVGHFRAVDLTTDRIQALQCAWQERGTSNPTINRRCNMLRRAFRLGQRARKVHVVPYIPRLKEQSPRGRYITPDDAASILAQLPAHLRPFFTFARLYGTRKGQLARTLRRFVDLERGVIAWPPDECKHNEAHTVPLDGEALDLVRRLMQRPPLHCPYLFHGAGCAPGRKPSKEYGCVGDFKRAWRTACKNAKLPVGRKAGGYVFHHTRNTAATDLRAGGMDESDAMKITGHQTAHVFKHYDLGDVEALRARLKQARTKVARVTRLRAAGTPKQRGAR